MDDRISGSRIPDQGRLAQYGRSPDHLKIMPGIFPVIGRTEQEAQEKFERLQDLIHPSIGLGLLSGLVGGIDLSNYPIDEPLPDLPETQPAQSRLKLVKDLAQREQLTIRQLYLALPLAHAKRVRCRSWTSADCWYTQIYCRSA